MQSYLKCYQLAEEFLKDHPEINCAQNCDYLAKAIQETIEEFIAVEKS